MNQMVKDPAKMRLEDIDVSAPELYEYDSWQPYFKRLREECPVHYQAESPFGPFWSVTKYDDICYVESHPEIFSSEPFITIGEFGGDIPVNAFIWTDPPLHDEQRAAVQPAVAPKNLQNFKDLIRQRTQEQLDSLPIGEEFDWVEKVSVDLTTKMLATLFAFPLEQRSKLTYWSDIIAMSPSVGGGSVDDEERMVGLQDCLAQFTQLWHAIEQQEPSFNLISLLQQGEATKDMVNDPMTYLGNIALLIVGGNDTTRNSMSGSVLLMNEFPDQFEKARDNEKLIPNLVSEVVRMQTPLAHMRRTAKQDTVLNGQQIKKGDKVVMWYLSANRDEDKIENPNQFIIDRPNVRQHLSFGFGVHRCMGNRLAEMQLQILWEEIYKRFSKIEIVGEVKRTGSNFVHGYEKMPVILTAK